MDTDGVRGIEGCTERRMGRTFEHIVVAVFAF
jgi:hypothetical protein